jgi:NAD(P)H-hydrate epimerase
MRIFLSRQIKEIDEYTIKHEPVSSADLMERAAGQLFNWIVSRYDRSEHFVIFAGPGNNGGDGLALARMLSTARYNVEVYYVNFTGKTSPDWEVNRRRLESETSLKFNYLSNAEEFPVISSGDIIIDALFGTGLTRVVEGLPAEIIKKLNLVNATVISIDIPSGLFSDDNRDNSYDSVVKADYTLSFQFPKLSFMFAESAPFAGEWEVLPIGLDPNVIRDTKSPYSLTGSSDVVKLIRKRRKFDHKGIFGHGLLVSGSSGKMGAAVLAAGASLRTGIGLITCHVPSCGYIILQCSVPEAMADTDKSENFISDIGITDSFDAVGAGPGLGVSKETQAEIRNLLAKCKKPLVLDADALNILSLNKEWLKLLPPNTILTPHPKEFERLAGPSENSYERLQKQIRFSRDHNCVVVLKGANTSVSSPGGNVWFNSTGNPGMAKAGSGDVLTGILLSLLSQGYAAENAAILGVYLHGLAGDIAVSESCYESIIASDLINCIGKAFNKIRESET